jgi:hypothetical protein
VDRVRELSKFCILVGSIWVKAAKPSPNRYHQLMKHSIIFIFLFIISCTGQDEVKVPTYLDFKGEGLTTKEDIKGLHLTSKGILFIGGQSETLSKEAVMYKSTDEGQNWKICYTGDGEIGKISSSDNKKLFALKYPDHSDNKSQYRFLTSNNSGESWENIPFPGEKILNYQIVNDSCYIMFVKDSRSSSGMYITYNSGVDWQFFNLLERNNLIDYSSAKVQDDVIHCLYNTQFHKDSMKYFSFDLISKDLKTSNIPIKLENPDIFLPTSGGVKLIEKFDDTVDQYKLSDQGVFVMEKKFDLKTENSLVELLEVENKLVAIIVTQKGHFNDYTMFFSENDGIDWYEIPDFNVVKYGPYDTYNSRLYGYLGKGELRLIDWK